MSAKRQRSKSANLHTDKKPPMEMTPGEQKAYAVSVGAEVDRLLARRGCHLDVQPGLAQAQNGTWTIGIVARILINQPTKAD